MPSPPIPSPPPAPNRATDTPDEFSNKADASVAYWPTLIDGITDVADFAEAKAEAAELQADAAAGSATTALGYRNEAEEFRNEAEGFADEAEASRDAILNADNTVSTSNTSHSFTTGSKVFTVQSGKGYAPGQFVIVARTSAPSSYMYGQVTAYSGTSLTVDVTLLNGTGGPFTDWTISGAPPIFDSPVLSLSDAEIRFLFGG